MKDVEARHIIVVGTFKVADKKIQELNTQLTEADRERKSAKAALQGAEKQAETQRKQLRQAEDELAATKKHIKVLKRKLEEAEKAIDKAEQDDYQVGVVETDEGLKVEVSEVCRIYCIQVWNEAHNQARVEAPSALRRAENIYCPPAIHESSSLGSKAGTTSKETDTSEDNPAKALPSSSSLPKEVEQLGVAKKKKDTTKGVVLDATKPLIAPNDSSEEKETSHNLEIILTTLPVPIKEDPKGKGPTSTLAETAKSTKATRKANPPLKINQGLDQNL